MILSEFREAGFSGDDGGVAVLTGRIVVSTAAAWTDPIKADTCVSGFIVVGDEFFSEDSS
jgi:hypothetical protein